jgi:hypothetical protein
MAQGVTLILLPETAYNNMYGNGAPYNVVGDEQPAAAFYLGNQDLQTVNYKNAEVTGNIIIQATLATTPADGDWFNVFEVDANANAPSGSNSYIASNASAFTNVDGTFVYMRALIEDFQGGVVNYVKLSY